MQDGHTMFRITQPTSFYDTCVHTCACACMPVCMQACVRACTELCPALYVGCWLKPCSYVGLQRSLQLSQEQRTEIVQLRRLFLTKLSGISQQRREIHQSLMVWCSSTTPSERLLSARVYAIPAIKQWAPGL